MRTIHVEKGYIPENFADVPVVIYGGGHSGKVLYRLFSEKGIKISNVIDDNENLQGEFLGTAEIVSFDEFKRKFEKERTVAILRGTIYGKSVLLKLEDFHFVQVYEVYDWLEDFNGLSRESFKDVKEVTLFRANLQSLSPCWDDEESRRVTEGLRRYVETEERGVLTDICTVEEHYFIPEVISAIHRRGEKLRVIDGGAYWGEMLQSFKKRALSVEKWYCFEASQENFKRLLHYSGMNGMRGKQICIDKGLWSSSGRLYFEEGQGAVSKIANHETDKKVEVISIDDYFKEISCNFIKMDIEGVELEALKGGIRTIVRDRPIMAISIYHSLADFWRIPQYLMERLNDYHYYVRHHSMAFSETVLYAIPY